MPVYLQLTLITSIKPPMLLNFEISQTQIKKEVSKMNMKVYQIKVGM